MAAVAAQPPRTPQWISAPTTELKRLGGQPKRGSTGGIREPMPQRFRALSSSHTQLTPLRWHRLRSLGRTDRCCSDLELSRIVEVSCRVLSLWRMLAAGSSARRLVRNAAARASRLHCCGDCGCCGCCSCVCVCGYVGLGAEVVEGICFVRCASSFATRHLHLLAAYRQTVSQFGRCIPELALSLAAFVVPR